MHSDSSIEASQEPQQNVDEISPDGVELDLTHTDDPPPEIPPDYRYYLTSPYDCMLMKDAPYTPRFNSRRTGRCCS